MNLTQTIKGSPLLKRLANRAMSPKGQARPRRWVNWFVLPFIIKKGKGAVIRRRTRFDVFPYNKFQLGEESTIEDFCTINNGVGDVIIGSQTRIGISSVLIGPVHIGDHVRLAQNVVISGLNHNYQDVMIPISQQGVHISQVYIGDETWIGANVVVLPGRFIGKHCVIAAGSVVTRDVPSYSVVAGNPARIVKSYNQDLGVWQGKAV